MTSWVLTICGICILSVVIDLVISDGQTNKHIKTAFSYIILLVIVSPVPSMLNKNFNINEILHKNEILVDDNYIYQLNQYKINMLKADIEKEIVSNGILGVEIAINCDIFAEELDIKSILVDLYNLVIDEKNKHINIEIVVVECIQKHIKIDKEQIFFNE